MPRFGRLDLLSAAIRQMLSAGFRVVPATPNAITVKGVAAPVKARSEGSIYSRKAPLTLDILLEIIQPSNVEGSTFGPS